MAKTNIKKLDQSKEKIYVDKRLDILFDLNIFNYKTATQIIEKINDLQTQAHVRYDIQDNPIFIIDYVSDIDDGVNEICYMHGRVLETDKELVDRLKRLSDSKESKKKNKANRIEKIIKETKALGLTVS